jgi:hypothetical protein
MANMNKCSHIFFKGFLNLIISKMCSAKDQEFIYSLSSCGATVLVCILDSEFRQDS